MNSRRNRAAQFLRHGSTHSCNSEGELPRPDKGVNSPLALRVSLCFLWCVLWRTVAAGASNLLLRLLRPLVQLCRDSGGTGTRPRSGGCLCPGRAVYLHLRHGKRFRVCVRAAGCCHRVQLRILIRCTMPRLCPDATAALEKTQLASEPPFPRGMALLRARLPRGGRPRCAQPP
jgi:hypothetical protein